MKKISIMLLAALMLFAFVACDDKTPAPEAATAEEISLVADYIDALVQKTVLEDVQAAVAAEGEKTNNVTATVGEGDKANVYTIKFEDYNKGTNNAQSSLKNVKLNGTVVLTLTKAENAAATFADATAYSIEVKDVKFTADQKTAVTLSLTAKGTINESHVIQYPAVADVTGLKVLFGETEKAVSWADIDAKITK